MNITKLTITISNILKSTFNSILDFIYPPICISCNTPLNERENKVCQKCWHSIPSLTREHSLFQETYSKLTAGGHISDLVSCFIFEKDGAFQHITHALKYQEHKSLGNDLGKRIAHKMLEWNISVEIIIPIPLHKIKYRERGYNQSEYIAQGIADTLHIPIVKDALWRKRNTQTQTKLNLIERNKNMEDAFEVKTNLFCKIENKICLLVDDVITTGATVNACAKELISSGSKSIIAASTALSK